MSSLPTPDPESAVAFLRRALPGDFWLLVAIDPAAANDDPEKCIARAFAARESSDAASWIKAVNVGERPRNVYWTVNRVERPIAKKPSKADISAGLYLHVDVDPDKRKPLDEERARIEHLTSYEGWPEGVPPATFLIDSGGGHQAFWRLSEPVPIEDPADFERYNVQLEVRFDADPCHNVDRIMRLPGTINWPDEKKRLAGRVPTLARVVRATEEDHPLAAFEPAPKVHRMTDAAFESPRPRVETGNVQRLRSLDELPEDVGPVTKVVIAMGHDPDNPRRWPSRSEAVLWVTCELVRRSVPDDVVYSILTDSDWGISESILEQGARASDYALRQIQRAHELAEDKELAELNAKHAVIGDIGGKCRVIAESHDPLLGRETFSVQTFEDFQNRYANRFVQEGEKTMPLGSWWIKNPSRRQYERMVFAPGKEIAGAYNLWRGFACEAIPGDCSLYLQHVLDNICSGDQHLYDYVMSWMARTVQDPAGQAHSCLVLRGSRGAGKGKFANTFGSLFGRHFFPVTSPSMVFGDFNEHLMDTVVLFADEAFFAGDKRNEAVLKGLVTEPQRTISAKFRAAETTANCLRIIMAANDDWVVPAGPHERRFLVLQVSDAVRQDRDYFAAIDRQMNSGGREALLHMLLKRDLSGYDPRDVPKTAALQEQKEHSLSLEQEYWYGRLTAGEIRDGGGWPKWVACSELAFDFGQYAKRWGGKSSRGALARLTRMLERLGCPRRQLGKEVEILAEDGELRRVDRPRVFKLVSLDEARRRWADSMGGGFDWGENQETVVDDDGYEAFS